MTYSTTLNVAHNSLNISYNSNILSLPNEVLNCIFNFNSDPSQRLVSKKFLEAWDYYKSSAIDKYLSIIINHFSKNSASLKTVKTVIALPNRSLKERAIKLIKVAEIIYCSKAENYEKLFTNTYESILGRSLLKKIQHCVNCLIKLNKPLSETEKYSSEDYKICEFYNEWSTFSEELYFKLHFAIFIKNKYIKQEAISRAITTSLSVGVPLLELLNGTEQISDNHVRDQCLVNMCSDLIKKKQFVNAHFIASKIISRCERTLQFAIIEERSRQQKI